MIPKPVDWVPPGWGGLFYETVDSTNRLAADCIAQGGARDRWVIAAGQQTGGRGRQGRVWASPPGNLYLSALLRWTAGPAAAAQVSLLAAVALAEAIDALCPAAAPRCKWPNDVICQGGKVAGILLDLRSAPAQAGEGGEPTGAAGRRPAAADGGGQPPPAWLIVGIGVNLAAAPAGLPPTPPVRTGTGTGTDPAPMPEPPAFPPVALAAFGPALSPATMGRALLERLDASLARWTTEGLGPIRTAWMARALGLDGPIGVRLSPTRRFWGRFVGLDEQGHLCLLQEDGSRRVIAAGEVVFPDERAALSPLCET